MFAGRGYHFCLGRRVHSGVSWCPTQDATNRVYQLRSTPIQRTLKCFQFEGIEDTMKRPVFGVTRVWTSEERKENQTNAFTRRSQPVIWCRSLKRSLSLRSFSASFPAPTNRFSFWKAFLRSYRMLWISSWLSVTRVWASGNARIQALKTSCRPN